MTEADWISCATPPDERGWYWVTEKRGGRVDPSEAEPIEWDGKRWFLEPGLGSYDLGATPRAAAKRRMVYHFARLVAPALAGPSEQ